MRMKIVLPFAAAILLSGCTAQVGEKPAAPAADATQDGAAALKPYADAVNANNADALTPLVTDDITLQAPDYPEVFGRDAVIQFASEYFATYTSHWDKTPRDFIVVGDWAFSRYGYTMTETNKADGSTRSETGKGMLVYRRENGGPWLVARDAWSSDKPAS